MCKTCCTFVARLMQLFISFSTIHEFDCVDQSSFRLNVGYAGGCSRIARLKSEDEVEKAKSSFCFDFIHL